MTFEEFLQKAEKSFGPLSDTQVRQYRQLEELYLDWNSKINVISRKDIGQLQAPVAPDSPAGDRGQSDVNAKSGLLIKETEKQ